MDKKAWIKRFLAVLLSVAVIVVIGFSDPDVGRLGPALAQASVLWLVLAFCCMLLHYFGDLLIYIRICRLMRIEQTFVDSIITVMIGFFYNALTPLQSGGQPMQILRMRAHGVQVGAATGALVVKTVAWLVSAFALATAGLVAFLGKDMAFSAAEKTVFFIGWGANLALIALFVLALLLPGGILRAGLGVLGFLKKRKLIRKEERYHDYCNVWRRTVSDFRSAIRFLIEAKFRALPIFAYGLLEVAGQAAVIYCVYRAFGLSGYGFFYIVLLQSMLAVGVSFVPLPGASIASEGGFYAVFGSIFGPALRFPAMLLWRFFTYYSNILLGLFAVLADGFLKKRAPGAGKS